MGTFIFLLLWQVEWIQAPTPQPKYQVPVCLVDIEATEKTIFQSVPFLPTQWDIAKPGAKYMVHLFAGMAEFSYVFRIEGNNWHPCLPPVQAIVKNVAGCWNLDPCLPEPPFWWLSHDIDREPKDPGSGEFYTTQSEFKEVEKNYVLGEMKLDNVEEYTPGEIYKNQKPQLQLGGPQPLQGIQWTPKSPDFYKPFDINSVPLADNYLYNMVKKRQQLDLASTLKEDSDYSVKGRGEVARCGGPVQPKTVQAPLPGILQTPQRGLRKEHFFCECHQYHSLAKSSPQSPTTVCGKCGCEYMKVDPSTVDASRRIMAAASSHISGTNPYCFRDVIGRN